MNTDSALIIDDCAGEVYLRQLQIEDTEMIVRWRNHPKVKKNFIYQKDFTKEGHNHWFKNMLIPGHAIQFVIVEKASNRAIGSVYLRDIDDANHKAEYGIFIGEIDAQGQGYGTTACRLLCQYGFEKLQLHKIFLRVFCDNIAARKSYEKAGFVEEGCFHDDVYIDGVYRDMVFMARYQ